MWLYFLILIAAVAHVRPRACSQERIKRRASFVDAPTAQFRSLLNRDNSHVLQPIRRLQLPTTIQSTPLRVLSECTRAFALARAAVEEEHEDNLHFTTAFTELARPRGELRQLLDNEPTNSLAAR